MKSRMIISLMVIALAAALIGGATMAWFTDSDASEPVTFTAGTLLIDIEGDNFAQQINSEEINLDILNPGDEFEFEFDVVNEGTKNLIFTGLLCYEDTIGQDRDDLPEDMVVTLETKGYGTDPLSEVLIVELKVVGNNMDLGYGDDAENAGVFYRGTLADYDNNSDPFEDFPTGLTLDPNSQPPIVFGEAGLTPGAGSTQNSLTYHVKFTLPTDAGDVYQGSSLDAAFVVMAKQIHPGAQYGAFFCPLE